MHKDILHGKAGWLACEYVLKLHYVYTAKEILVISADQNCKSIS